MLVRAGSSRYSVPRKGQDSWIPLILFLRLAFLGILEIYIFFLNHKAVKGSSQTLVTGLQIQADLCMCLSAQNSPCRHRALQWRASHGNRSSPSFPEGETLLFLLPSHLCCGKPINLKLDILRKSQLRPLWIQSILKWALRAWPLHRRWKHET